MTFASFFSFSQLSRRRLNAAIDSIEIELHMLEKARPDVTMEAREALNKAKEHARRNAAGAWNYVNETEVYMLKALDEHGLRAKASQLCIEASEKISAWRQKQIWVLIGKPDSLKANVTLNDVMAAMRIRNDFYNTQFHKLSMRRVNLNILSLLLVSFILSIVVTSLFGDFPHAAYLWQQVLVVIQFGALGACLSMAYTITSTPMTSKIPEQMMGFFITVIRLAIGATAALVSFLLIKSSLLSTIFSDDFLKSDYAYLIIAFIAGFSERWVINIIDKVANDQKK